MQLRAGRKQSTLQPVIVSGEFAYRTRQPLVRAMSETFTVADGDGGERFDVHHRCRYDLHHGHLAGYGYTPSFNLPRPGDLMRSSGRRVAVLSDYLHHRRDASDDLPRLPEYGRSRADVQVHRTGTAPEPRGAAIPADRAGLLRRQRTEPRLRLARSRPSTWSRARISWRRRQVPRSTSPRATSSTTELPALRRQFIDQLVGGWLPNGDGNWLPATDFPAANITVVALTCHSARSSSSGISWSRSSATRCT